MIAANRNDKRIILGECKWRSEINFAAEVRKLMDKGHLPSEYKDRYYYIFTKASLKGKQISNATLVTAEKLFEV